MIALKNCVVPPDGGSVQNELAIGGHGRNAVALPLPSFDIMRTGELSDCYRMRPMSYLRILMKRFVGRYRSCCVVDYPVEVSRHHRLMAPVPIIAAVIHSARCTWGGTGHSSAPGLPPE